VLFKQLFFLSLIICLLFRCNKEQEDFSPQNIPDPKKNDGGYVSDPDGLLSEATVTTINAMLQRLDVSGKAQVAVVAVKSIGENVPKDFAVELFKYWGIGTKEKDNGLLILIVEDQHRIEFEVGYGLEGDLTDMACYRIQQEHMVPYARDNDLDQAVIEGVRAVARHLTNATTEESSGERDESDEKRKEVIFQKRKTFTINDAITVLSNSFFAFIIPSIFSFGVFGLSDEQKKKLPGRAPLLFNNKLYESIWTSSLVIIIGAIVFFEILSYIYQEINFPFYVTLFAFYLSWYFFVHVYHLVLLPLSLSFTTEEDQHDYHEILSEAYKHLKTVVVWFPSPFLLLFKFWHVNRLKKLREDPCKCECGNAMRKQSESEDDLSLEKGQIAEERIKSNDYDVWMCDVCKRKKILRYEDFNSKYETCEKCSAKTTSLTKEEVVVKATASSSGYGYRIYNCVNCDHIKKVKYTIPPISSSSGGITGHGGSGSASSSRGSSSGGSWGGGSSGGGGAGSTW
jgi:uncharacterized protein